MSSVHQSSNTIPPLAVREKRIANHSEGSVLSDSVEEDSNNGAG